MAGARARFLKTQAQVALSPLSLSSSPCQTTLARSLYIELDALAFFGGSHSQQGPDRVRHPAILADQPADIVRRQAQLKCHYAAAAGFLDRHLRRIVDQRASNVFEQLFHGAASRRNQNATTDDRSEEHT